jgi:vacuolar-type H+-ATPase subunit I/STV1
MTGSEDLMRIKNWQIEALQKENKRLTEKLNKLKLEHEQEIENALIKQRLEIQKDQILKDYE